MNRRRLLSRIPIACVVLLAPAWGHAGTPPFGATTLIAPGSMEAARFSGVARFGTGCTAFLIRPPGASSASPAYAATAGHCIDLGANDVIVNRPDTTRVLAFGLLQGLTAPRLQVRSRQVAYSTMRGVDLALVELDSTLGAMEAAGIAPLTLGGEMQPLFDRVADWAGVPSGRTPSGEVFLRTGECFLLGTANVLEWRWFWRGQIRHDCSDMSTGASGAPLISRSSGQVLGVIGTTNAGNPPPTSDGLCGRNDPCELEGGRGLWRRNTSYATPVAALAGCFVNGRFDLQTPACGVDPGVQAAILEARLSAMPGARWNVNVTSPATSAIRYFRYKTFAQDKADPGSECRNPAGYSAPAAIPARITDPLPSVEGRYWVCVLAGATVVPDATWQQPRFASLAHVRIDATAPTLIPDFDLLQNERGFTFIPNSDLSTGLVPKVDSALESSCDQPDGYRRIIAIPMFIPREGARRLCLLVEDGAGNASAPWEVDLVGPSLFPAGVTSSAGYTQGKAAPGAWVSLFGVNLVATGDAGAAAVAGTKVWFRGGDGVAREMTTTFATVAQINARLPQDAPLGAGVVVVETRQGQRTSRPLTLEPTVPGIFSIYGSIHGVSAAGSLQPATSCASGPCLLQPLTGIRTFSIYTGGLGRVRTVEVLLSEQQLEVLSLTNVAPGVDQLLVRIPEGLQLRGYLPVRVQNGGSVSPEAYVWLR